MSSRIPGWWILSAALLISGVAYGTSATEPPAAGGAFAEVLSAQSVDVGAPLPAGGLSSWIFMGADGELRGGRAAGSSTLGSRQGLRRRYAPAVDAARERSGDAHARLMRAGLDSSSLGTPPPHS